MADKLRLTLSSEEVNALGGHYPGFELTIEADLTHSSVHDWFKIFEKILLAQGFDTFVIQKGAVELAFNEWRDTKEMRRLYAEYDLDEFGKLPGEE